MRTTFGVNWLPDADGEALHPKEFGVMCGKRDIEDEGGEEGEEELEVEENAEDYD